MYRVWYQKKRFKLQIPKMKSRTKIILRNKLDYNNAANKFEEMLLF